MLVVLLTASLAESQVFIPPETTRYRVDMGATPWKFIKQDVAGAHQSSFNDSSWQDVGIPHCYSQFDTYLNTPAGTAATGNTVWYRKRFALDADLQGRTVYLVFERVNVGCAVYVNGRFVPGNTAVPQPSGSSVTHVGGFIPFMLDITTYVVFGSTNVLALRVENAQRWDTTWFTTPPGAFWGMGSAHGGILAPVWLIAVTPVHVPPNVYSVTQRWGTHYTTTRADGTRATVFSRLQVYNRSSTPRQVSAVTCIVDASGTIAAELHFGPRSIGGFQSYIFEGTVTVNQPRLWYPNNSLHGVPYLYTAYSMIYEQDNVVDWTAEKIGLRVITWDSNYAYVNGIRHPLWGGSMRYDYPGLGQAVPRDQRWRDMKLIADCGGNFFRPAHCAAEMATIEACDTYGILVTQPCQDDEGATQTSDHVEYKKEFMRDICVYNRNNPSILAWEIKNGGAPSGFAATMKQVIQTWDPVLTRAIADTNYASLIDWNLADIVGVMNYAGGDKRNNPNKPVYSCEAWLICSGRQAWREEHAETYVNWYVQDTNAQCAGGMQFMFIDMPGEDWPTVEGPHGRGDGRGALDMNRIPKMLYHVWQRAVWIPFEKQPGVYIGHHWNRNVPFGTTVTVKVWSNCPYVELFLNGISYGTKTPNPATARPEFQCSWVLPYATGTLHAVGKNSGGVPVCSDEQRTAGRPSRIVLSVVEPIRYADGTWSRIRANGSDCAFITAAVVDDSGVVCPTSSHTLTFSVSGPGTYIGGTNFYYTPNQPVTFNAPGNVNLAVEAGLVRVAVRSTFAPGTVTVGASCSGLQAGATQFITVVPDVQQGFQGPAQLSIQAERDQLFADGVSSSVVTVFVLDGQGMVVVTSSAQISFSVIGPGILIGSNLQHAVQGKATIVVRALSSTGTVSISAHSSGLASTTTFITVRTPNVPPSPPLDLRCDGQTNAVGVTRTNPVLSWRYTDADDDPQGYWRVIVSSDWTHVDQGLGDRWDSGKSVGGSSWAVYGGLPLVRATTYYWRVMTWDIHGASSSFSDRAVFSMAGNLPPYRPENLRTNGLVNPSSVTTPRPVLSWHYTDPDGDAQGGCHILMSNNMVDFGNVWDSGYMNTASSSVAYGGSPLTPGFYYWMVRAWDVYGSSSELSGTAMFTYVGSTTNASPLVQMLSPVNGSTYTAPATLNLAATATDPDGTIVNVRFYRGSTLLNTDTSSPYSYNWVNVSSGTYQLRAVAQDNQGATSTSTLVTVTVLSSSTPAVWYTLTTAVNPANGGTVSPASGTYLAGSQIQVTATPNTNYTFANWSGDVTGTNPTITLTMDGDKNITANFRAVQSPEPAQPVLQPGEVRVIGSADGYINATQNPNVIIRFRRTTAGTVTVRIYDLRGRLVMEKRKDGVAGIDDDIAWNAADLPTGVYLVRVKGDGVEASKRVVIVR